MAEKKKSAVSAAVTEEEGKKKVKAEEKGKENVQVGTAPKKRGRPASAKTAASKEAIEAAKKTEDKIVTVKKAATAAKGAKAEKTEEKKRALRKTVKKEEKPAEKVQETQADVAENKQEEVAVPMPEVQVVKRKRILIAASECRPFVATGGLSDVIGSLPQALAKNPLLDVNVILPLYACIGHEYRHKMEYITNFYVQLSWRRLYCGVFKLVENGVTYYFLDNEYYFKRGGNIYGFYDDGERFAFFSKAILDTIGALDIFPDVLHVNDWQTAASIIYLRSLYNWSVDFQKIKTLFTIHNIEYQGKFGNETRGDLFGFPSNIYNYIEFDGCINLMKGAIEMADAVNTVSPTYANEIKDPFFAHGLDGIIRRNEQKLCGILNGIDVESYNPATDPYIFANYSQNDMSGKKICKAELQKMLSLPIRADVPVVSVVSRLVSHKGLDLVKAVIEQFLSEDVQVVILGKGDAAYENYFTNLARSYQGKCVTVIAFNADLSRKIYSGSDIFLMPSKTEPCGLSQMIASRYGTVAVVRETGGLNDSIKPYTGNGGNGFTFRDYNAHDMLYVLREAARTYHDKAVWEDIVRRAMESDFSWNNSAKEYEKVYKKISG